MIRTFIAAVAVSLIAAGASAQTAPADRADRLLGAPAPNASPGMADRQAPDSAQDPQELRITRALNAEIASRNALAENQEQADRAAFERERARHEEEVMRATRDRLAHEEAVRQAEAARRRWEADRARWEADVRACEAGDRRFCARPAS